MNLNLKYIYIFFFGGGGGGGVGRVGGRGKGTSVNDFFYKESISKNREFFFFGGGGVDGWTDVRGKSICPFKFFKVGGITMHTCTSYGPDKLSL